MYNEDELRYMRQAKRGKTKLKLKQLENYKMTVKLIQITPNPEEQIAYMLGCQIPKIRIIQISKNCLLY